AGGIVGVQRRQHQVAGERGLDRDARGLQVAHLADHDDVRVLAHDRTQRVREVEPDLRLGLDLVDALDLVLDRVLDGDDLDVRRVELAQRRVQRGGLARAGRAGDQQDAVRLLQHLAELRQEPVGEAEPLEVQHHRLAVEQAHHHALTVRGRHRADAQVQLLALHPQHDPAILRQASLGDVELAHDLDAAYDRRGQIDRRAFAIDQHAIDAVTYLQAVHEWLDVDVGRTQLDRALDHEVYQADDRRLGGQDAQVLDIVEVAAFALGGLHDRTHRAAALPEPALDQLVDFRAQRNMRAHLAAGRQPHRVEHVRIVGIGGQDVDRLVAFGHGTDGELLHEADRERTPLGRQFWQVLGADQCEAQHGGDRLGVVALGHQAEPSEQCQQAAAGFCLQPARATKVRLLEAPLPEQGIDDPVFQRVATRAAVHATVAR